MDITTLLAAVAAFGLPCSSPELREFPEEQMPWPAAYIQSIEGHNIIALRDGSQDDERRLSKILVHELLHCEDFAGNYNGVSAGAALVYGASSGVLENHSGVVIRLHAKTSGAELKLAGDAFEVKLP